MRCVHGRWSECAEEDFKEGSAQFRLKMISNKSTGRWPLSRILRKRWSFDRWRGPGRNISELLRSSVCMYALFILGNEHTDINFRT